VPPCEYYYRVHTPNYKGTEIRKQLLTEPPATVHLSDAELYQLVDDPTRLDIFAPCHSQSVEHGVAVTSLAVKRFRTRVNQLGASLQIEHARKVTPGEVTHKSRNLVYEEKD
jgi:hypothetical protein